MSRRKEQPEDLETRLAALEQQIGELAPLALVAKPSADTPQILELVPALAGASALASTAYSLHATPADVESYMAAVEAAPISAWLRRALLDHVAPRFQAAHARRFQVADGARRRAEQTALAEAGYLAALHVESDAHARVLAQDGITAKHIHPTLAVAIEKHLSGGRPACSWLIATDQGAWNQLPLDEQEDQRARHVLRRAVCGGIDDVGKRGTLLAYAHLRNLNGLDAANREVGLITEDLDTPRGAVDLGRIGPITVNV